MNIKITDAAKYFKGLPHQVEAFQYLQGLISEPELKRFAELYRTPKAEPPQPADIRLVMKPSGDRLNGFRVFRLQLVNDGKTVDQVSVLSGGGYTQDESFVRPENDYSGSMRCLPEGVYAIGPVEDAGSGQSWGEGLGRYWISINNVNPQNNRANFGIHLDDNAAYSPGSAGCVCPFNPNDFAKILKWLNAKARPDYLYCDLGLGTLEHE